MIFPKCQFISRTTLLTMNTSVSYNKTQFDKVFIPGQSLSTVASNHIIT